MEQNPSTSLFELHIDAPSSAYLSETAKWAKFFAILGFIFCGLIVCGAFFAGSIMSALSGMRGYTAETSGAASVVGGAFIAIFYIAFALLYFFPCLYLFRFSTKMKQALRTNDQEQLATSFKNLKSCFRFLGILTIVVLSIYVLVLIFVVLGAVAASR